MTDNEKKILEALDTATKDVKVPESLTPDQLQEKLGTHKQKFWKRKYTYALAAACMVLVLGGSVLFGALQKQGLISGTANSSADGSKEIDVSDQIASAKDYKEVYSYFEEMNKEMEADSSDTGFWGNASSSDTMVTKENTQQIASAADNATAGTGGKAYSDTNVRTEGVGEADIVKTDGTYLYVLKESAAEIAIVDTTTDMMEEIAVVEGGSGAQISEFYVNGTQLFVLSTVTQDYMESEARVTTYDISDIRHPKAVGEIRQSGFYKTSRFVDGYLYMFSTFSVYGTFDQTDQDIYVPKINGQLLPEDHILLPPVISANQYTVVTSINVERPDEVTDQLAVLSQNGECYVSAGSIYIYEGRWNYARSSSFSDCTTVIRKISYEKGTLSGEAQGKVKGYLNDSFSIDEYDGTLRLVTTIEGVTSRNAVYVLDQDLKTIGKITDLAEGERVYSARFYGKTGYFVTYRQTDPLFSVDFSDPENPEIIGTLKIPGFSEYLHFYGENLLLGIGMDTEEETGVTNGVKISMFDISDPTDVKEVQKYTIKGAYSSDVFYDYRAVLIDGEENRIGFSAYGNNGEMYQIFSYDTTNGFNLEMQEEVSGASYLGTRGVTIGGQLYVVKGNAIESYRLKDYVKVDDLIL